MAMTWKAAGPQARFLGAEPRPNQGGVQVVECVSPLAVQEAHALEGSCAGGAHAAQRRVVGEDRARCRGGFVLPARQFVGVHDYGLRQIE